MALSSIGDDAIIPQLKKVIEDVDVRNSALIAFEYLTYLKQKKETEAQNFAVKPKIRL